MLYVEVTRHATKTPFSAKVLTAAELEIAHATHPFPHKIEDRNDWKTFQEAETIAKLLNQSYEDLHHTFQATDAGPYVSPRYDVIDLPQIADEVSYTFNGDYYPCGKIKSISKAPGYRKIVTEETRENGDVFNHVFYRRCRDGKPTGGAWVMNGTWSMIQGHHDRRNPEF